MDEARNDEEKSSREREKELKREYKKVVKGNHPKRRAFEAMLVALVVGVVVGAGAVLWIQSTKPAESEQPSNVSVVFSRVMEQNKLVAASQKYQVVEKVRDANMFFDLVEIPFTENSYWYRYVGTIEAAVDLSTAQLIGQEGDVITISLDKPFVSSNTPDMDESGVLEENNNILNPIHLQDADEYRKLCMERVESEAENGNLFEEAKANAASDLGRLFSVALGEECEVEIQWRGEE